jgi:hypothetical protein
MQNPFQGGKKQKKKTLIKVVALSHHCVMYTVSSWRGDKNGLNNHRETTEKKRRLNMSFT